MCSLSCAQGHSLAVTFDSSGLQSLRCGATEFLARSSFEVNAIQFLSADGHLSNGSTKHKVIVDQSARSTKLIFDWGAVNVQYLAQPEKLVLDIRTTNQSRSAIEALSYDALALKLQHSPAEYDGVIPMLGTNIGSPTVLPLSYGPGAVVLSNEDVRRPLLIGFPWAVDRPANRTFPLRINTGREAMYPNSLPAIERPIVPGMTDRFTLSLQFLQRPATVSHIAPDLFELFRGMDPFTLKWPDRRPIGSLIIGTAAAGWPKNPRGWLLDPKLDTTTPGGVALFQSRLLAWADRSVSILKKMNAQGMVTWDVEGEQFPHATTYIGDPKMAEIFAPEMRGVIDEYFARFRRAGLRVGLTIRPQTVVVSDGGRRVEQTESKDPAAVLISKIEYAKRRWGATLFYIDSNGDPALPLSFDVMKRVAERCPDVLLMPEHKNAAYYSKTAPYAELRGGAVSTPALAREIYRDSFSVINTADGPVDTEFGQLRQAVKRGDILMFRAWYDDGSNAKIKALATGR